MRFGEDLQSDRFGWFGWAKKTGGRIASWAAAGIPGFWEK
jgi:hypothetical protein